MIKVVALYQTPEYRPVVEKFEVSKEEEALPTFLNLLRDEVVEDEDGGGTLEIEDFKRVPCNGKDVEGVEHYIWKSSGYRITLVLDIPKKE